MSAVNLTIPKTTTTPPDAPRAQGTTELSADAQPDIPLDGGNAPVTSVWTDGHDKIAANMCDNAKAYEWMHETTQSMFALVNIVVMGIVGTISAASSMSNTVVSALATKTGFDDGWIFGIVATLQTGFMIIINQIGFKRRADQHTRYASDWRRVKLLLTAELAVPRNMRKDCVFFMQIIRKDIDLISSASDSLIPLYIRRRCYDKFSEVPNFNVPEMCGFMQHTTVYTEDVTPASGGLQESPAVVVH